ncbi:hypothetical protein CH370_04535 [Leptospira kmetyi]|nr:hypothetical protein CH370_04535 [Leptospira kmetyi]
MSEIDQKGFYSHDEPGLHSFLRRIPKAVLKKAACLGGFLIGSQSADPDPYFSLLKLFLPRNYRTVEFSSEKQLQKKECF